MRSPLSSSLLFVLALVLLAVMTTASSSQQQPQPRERETPQVPGVKSLAAENHVHIVGMAGVLGFTIPGQLATLGPDVLVVEVREGAGGGTPPYIAVPEDVAETIQGITPEATASVIFRVSDRQSRLTRDQDWISSTVTGRVLRVLKDDTSSLSEGGTIAFEEDGGALIIDGRRVFTNSPYALPTQTDREYLVFLSGDASFWRNIGAATTFELKAGRIERRLRPDVGVSGEVQTTEEVVSTVRSAALLRKGGGRP